MNATCATVSSVLHRSLSTIGTIEGKGFTSPANHVSREASVTMSGI